MLTLNLNRSREINRDAATERVSRVRVWWPALALAGAIVWAGAHQLLVQRGAATAIPGPQPLEEAELSEAQSLPAVLDDSHRDAAPLRIKPVVSGLLPLAPADCEWVRRQVQIPSTEPPLVGACCHLLRMHGLGAALEGDRFRTTDDLVQLLLDDDLSERHLGRSAVVRTRHGLRFPTQGTVRERIPTTEKLAFEGHRDQCLGTLAEAGVPLSRPILVDGIQYSLYDVLRDSLANFYIDQRELEWTAVTYTLYLPPQREWVNRFGERFTFDDLAEELLDRKSEKATCFGTHLFYAWTLLLRADAEQSPILSAHVRTRLREQLAKVVEVAVRQQQESGAWTYSWDADLRKSPRSQSYPLEREESLLATGHLAEWLQYLPVDLQPPQEVHIRAAMWLLKSLRSATPEERWKGLCPCTHAACVIRQLMYSDESLIAPQD